MGSKYTKKSNLRQEMSPGSCWGDGRASRPQMDSRRGERGGKRKKRREGRGNGDMEGVENTVEIISGYGLGTKINN